jgi:hypothetical protein
MKDIEQLLRDSLRDAPTPVPTAADPVPLVDRRVRRARRLLGAGAAAGIALVAAGIAVPLALRNDGAAKVGIIPATHAPSPVPLQPLVPSVQTLAASGAAWVSTSDDGHVWYSTSPAGSSHLIELNAAGAQLHQSPIKAPGDLVVAGTGIIWVVGSDEGGKVLSRIAAYAPSGELLDSIDYPKDLLSYATQVNDDLYVVRSNDSGVFVERVTGVGGRLVTARVSVPGAETIAATAAGHVWVSTSTSLVQIEDTGTALRRGSTVPWSGPILGVVAGGHDVDAVWSYDGSRVVELSPALLRQGLSVAEGARIPVPRTPSWVVSNTARDVFVAMNDDPVEIFYFRGDKLGSGSADSIMEVAGGQVNAMIADPAGGVDVVDNSGQLLHWTPRH